MENEIETLRITAFEFALVIEAQNTERGSQELIDYEGVAKSAEEIFKFMVKEHNEQVKN